MIENYKVIKPFSNLKPADVLTYNADCDVFVFEEEITDPNLKCTSYRSTDISSDLIDTYVKAGLLEAVNSEECNSEECNCCNLECKNKLEAISAYLKQLKDVYKNKETELNDGYNEGTVKACVKVEFEAVKFNIMKLINKLENIIND